MSEQSLLHINADLKDLAAIRRFVEDAAKQGNENSKAVEDMIIATNEAVTNVLIHGYRGQPGIIEVEVSYDNHDLIVRLRDQAPLFDPTTVPSLKTAPSLDQPCSGGMGIHMMRQLTDELIYGTTSDGRNELVLIKKDVRN